MKIEQNHGIPPYQTPLSSFQIKCVDSSGTSTLSTLGATSCVGGLISFCLSPIRWLSSIVLNFFSCVRNFCCCGKRSSYKRIDYLATRSIFNRIHTIVLINSESHDSQKEFGKAYRELSEPAQDRFREHIGWAIAAHQGEVDRGDQERWLKENWSKIQSDINACLQDVQSNELSIAVKSFRKEIERNCK